MVTSHSSAASILTAEQQRGLKRQARILGLISLTGPLAMNMYVPAFPLVAASLGTDLPSVQLTITSYLVALAVGQMVYGPASDRFGRKPALYAGLLLFVAGSIAVAMADTLPTMIAWRLVQGLGGCAAIAIPRAIMRDQHTGPDAARMLAGILLMVALGPTIAPLAGSLISASFGWQVIFWVIAGTGLIGLALVHWGLPETLPRERRTKGRGFLGGYAGLLKDPRFMSAALIMAMGQAVFLSYLAASPTVFLGMYGLTSLQFSLIYAVGAIVWGASAQVAPRLMERWGAARAASISIRAAFVLTAILFGVELAGVGGLWFLVTSVCLIFAALGIMLPTATVEALHPHGAVAGAASALLGTIGFALGAAVTALVSALSDGTDIPMVAVMATCALCAELLAWIAFRRPAKA